MPRVDVPVIVPGATGTATAPATADATNNMSVPGYTQGMRIVFGAPAAGTTNWTIKQVACPTCGVSTDRTVSMPAGAPSKVLANLDPRLFVQADRSLWLNPSQADGTVYAIASA